MRPNLTRKTFDKLILLRNQLAQFIHLRRDLLIISLGYGVARLLTALFTQMSFASYGPSFEQFLWQGRASLSGAYPFVHYWVEYPPMFPWLALAAYRVSLWLPPWGDVWFGTFLRWSIVPFELGAVLLVYAIGRRFNPEGPALLGTFLYAIAFATTYVPLGWFDMLPLFWLLLALYFTLRDHPGWTGVAVGLGLLAKPIVVLVLPTTWQRLPQGSARLWLILASLAAVLLPLLPFFILSPHMLLAHVQNLAVRPSWETVWALLDGYYGSGAVAPVEQRFDVASALWRSHTGGGAYGWLAALAFGGLGLFLWTRKIDWRDARRTTAFVALTWGLFALWSKGYSPQWSVTFVPFIALLMPNLRGALYLGLLGIALAAEWPLAFTLVADQPWFLAAVIIWRTLLIALLTVDFGSIALAGALQPRWQVISRVAFGALFIGLGVMGWYAGQSYFQSRLEADPLNASVSELQKELSSQTGLICRDARTCERMVPFIPTVATYWLPTTTGWQADNLATFAQQHLDLWLAEAADQTGNYDLTLEQYLSERYGRVSTVVLGNVRLTRFAAVTLAADQNADLTYGEALRLKAYAVNTADRFISLKIVWEVVAAPKASLKIFVHVYNAAGELVGQTDQVPGGGLRPTDQWQAGQRVQELYGIVLPGPVEPGYTLQVGWYEPNTGQRLPTDQANDFFEIVMP